MWQTVVLIPKGKGEFREIGLVEVTWKVMTVILHQRLTVGIKQHDALHGFREGRGTGTAILEDKLLQQLAAMREEVPVPQPSRNPCSASCNLIPAVSRRCRFIATTFQVTSTSPIPLNSPFPFGISTTVCHVASSARFPSQNAGWVISTTFPHSSPPSSSASVFSSPFSQRLSRRQVSTSRQISTRSCAFPARVVLALPAVDLRRAHNLSWAPSAAVLAYFSAPLCIRRVPGQSRSVDVPPPCSDQNCV